ncbi:GFA family protein [Parasulfitobacter algicola]|uniref:GFA family protein n=1 Tax=Parasulfitobacter algicola TaxID=2614809 RepID=A0ABX2IN22_9RHOB|nr:GFA family protein [Sulfitobacter algicola]NSX53381.1 GFA family protein [Sulfitobacter algicola]
MHKGSCLCGDITYQISGAPRGLSVCHCGQCRTQSGHVWASGVIDDADITINGPVAWYAASDVAKRGFCARCGSFLFWKLNTATSVSFSLGSLERPTGLTLEKHIYVADKGDYYDITDGLPQHDQ